VLTYVCVILIDFQAHRDAFIQNIKLSFLCIKLVLRIVSTHKNLPAVCDVESYARLYNMDSYCIGLGVVEWL